MEYDDKQSIVLKPERDKHVRNKHPWVFMGAIASYPEFSNGDLLPVINAERNFIGYGYFNRGQSISGRMVSFREGDPMVAIRESMESAAALRKIAVPPQTDAYRLVNGEGDNLPGLIVDVYKDVAVLQINTLGMENLKPMLVEKLREMIPLKGIYEKSNSATRKKEGLPPADGWAYKVGNFQTLDEAEILEHGLRFTVNFTDSQKTGFFLDQREMRNLVKQHSKGRRVLNCFSYTGGFTVYALAGGAEFADSVDISESAVDGARKNVKLNGFSSEANGFFSQDVSGYLQDTDKDYDFIILDPPAFAKRASDIKNASRGYREINRLAMLKLPAGGLLLTSSCSAHIDRQLFQTIIFQAAKDAKRNVRIISCHILAADHPVNLFYPEGDYLKSLLLYMD
jgi:23S rRNA (cytosine1962-C5)-methyltransferase